MLLLNKNNYLNIVKVWLFVSILLVISMIVIGGLTRLTDSGLSITQWQLFSGIFPPFSNSEWNYYFSLYKKIPQYKLLNFNITLNEFKIIFYWEYFHRLMGRLIGLFFILPLLFFSLKKIFKKSLLIHLYFIFLLISLQGFIGWFMVSSGLTENVTVSHYRLSLHLLMAFIILSNLIWIYFNIKYNQNINFFTSKNQSNLILIFVLFIFIQIILGAFVSGLDAGKLYQTWPKMNNSYFPDDFIIKNLGNFFNFSNASLVQFYHRITAYLIFIFFLILGTNILFRKKIYLYKSYFIVFIFLIFQIFLGIITLISGLNIYLASLHQIGSIFLLISSLSLYNNELAHKI